MALFGLLPDAPKPPDPTKTANQALDYSKQAAQGTLALNAQGANRSGPFGSTTTQVDANGVPTGQTASLSGALQGSADNLTSNLGAQTGLLPSGPFDPNVDASGIRQSYIDNANLAAQPEWARQDKQNEVRLAERGIPIGSEVWGDVADQTSEGRNAYLRGAANDAYIAGTAEEQRQRNNQLQDYQLPYQTAQSNLGLLQGVGGLTPGFASLPTASVNDPNYAGLVQNNYQNQVGAYNSTIGGIGDLVKTGVGLAAAPFTGGASLAATGLLPTANGLSGQASSWPTTINR